MEIALSRLCGQGDVITPLAAADELFRQRSGGLSPRNYVLQWRNYSMADWRAVLSRRKWPQYRNHSTAEFVREHIGEALWASYFKFSIERDPFDKAISRYYWSTQPPRPSVAVYLDAAPASQLSNWHIYTINDQVAVDFMVRYEHLSEDLAMVAERLGLPPIDLPRAKGDHREKRAHYSTMIDSASRARIERVCTREIERFGYRWQSSSPEGRLPSSEAELGATPQQHDGVDRHGRGVLLP